MSFHIYLVSNNSGFTDNERNRFKVNLPSPLHLDGDWETGISELQVTSSVMTLSVNNDDNADDVLLVNQENKMRGIRIGGGNFTSMTDLCTFLNKSVSQLKSLPRGSLDRTSNHDPSVNKWLETFVEKPGKSDLNPKIKFHYDVGRNQVLVSTENIDSLFINKKLRSILGVGEGQYFDSKKPEYCHNQTNLSPDSLYIYCSLIEEQIVSNVYAQLLGVVVLPPAEFGSRVCVRYNRIDYVPVVHSEVPVIHVSIRDSLGKLTDLTAGNTLLKLHLRRKGVTLS